MNRLDFLMNKKVLFLIGILLVGTLIWALIYQFLIFHITYLSPAGDKLPTSQQTITISTNRPIHNVEVTTYTPHSKRISGNDLFIELNTPPEEGEGINLTVTLRDKSGNKITYHRQLTATYIPSSQADARERERRLKESNSFEDLCPVHEKLPYITTNFELSSEFPDAYESKMKIIYLDKTFNQTDTVPTDAELQQMRQNITTAQAWLKTNGYNNTCQLYFWQPYLLDEFNAKYYDAFQERGD